MRRNYGSYSINEIAEKLGLSRNTISKALNNKPGVSDRTRQLVQQYIDEKTGVCDPGTSPVPAAGPNTIMFSYRLENIEYINGLLSGIEHCIRESGYLLVVNIVSADARRPYFPPSVYSGSICGIISFNIYDEEYWNEVLSLDIPSVFLDSDYRLEKYAGRTDIISQENKRVIFDIIRRLHQAGRRDFAFFGYPYFCNSLYRRWQAFKAGLNEVGLMPNMDCSILNDFGKASDEDCHELILAELKSMSTLPDTFICASDRQAIMLMRALRELSIDVPGKVAVMGFDNVPETARQLPPLSTVEANSKYQGVLAVRKLLERIHEPQKPHEYIECETKLVLRESTGNIPRD